MSLLWGSAKAERRTIRTFHLFIYPLANDFFLSLHLLLPLFLACSFTLSLSLFIGLSVSLYPSVCHCSLPLSFSLSFSPLHFHTLPLHLSLQCSLFMSLPSVSDFLSLISFFLPPSRPLNHLIPNEQTSQTHRGLCPSFPRAL